MGWLASLSIQNKVVVSDTKARGVPLRDTSKFLSRSNMVEVANSPGLIKHTQQDKHAWKQLGLPILIILCNRQWMCGNGTLHFRRIELFSTVPVCAESCLFENRQCLEYELVTEAQPQNCTFVCTKIHLPMTERLGDPPSAKKEPFFDSTTVACPSANYQKPRTHWRWLARRI